MTHHPQPLPLKPGAPWLSPEALRAALTILRSHQRAYGCPLLAGLRPDASPEQQAQALFAAGAPVLAHDGSDAGREPGPRLIYANQAALVLWRRPWSAMVGLPSQLTAEPAQRRSRRRALEAARTAAAITGYSGVRVDSHGRRFQIRGARLWTLWDEAGAACGQAARFSDWFWL